jgi:hypothetical protein
MILKIAAFVLLIGCAPVEPGTLTKTIRTNESQRIYQSCMQQPTRNRADLRRHCEKVYILTWANWAWEDCINEGTRYCGDRPRYEDIQ